VHKRTLYGRTYYTLTDAGLALLARIEKEAGVADLTAAEIAMRQATAAVEEAQHRQRTAMEALRLARKEAGERYALEGLLQARREYPLDRN
jgi:DNA-binding PadR family transcriptional regulator